MYVGLVQRNPTTACKCWVTLSLTQPTLGFFDLIKIRNRKRLQYSKRLINVAQLLVK